MIYSECVQRWHRSASSRASEVDESEALLVITISFVINEPRGDVNVRLSGSVIIRNEFVPRAL